MHLFRNKTRYHVRNVMARTIPQGSDEGQRIHGLQHRRLLPPRKHLRIEAIRVAIEDHIHTAAGCSGNYGVAEAKVDSNDAHLASWSCVQLVATIQTMTRGEGERAVEPRCVQYKIYVKCPMDFFGASSALRGGKQLVTEELLRFASSHLRCARERQPKQRE